MSDAFLAQQWPRLTPDPNLGRWAPKFDAPDNPYDELDNELKGPPPTQEEVPEGKPLLQKTSSESPYADLDAELDKSSKLGPGDKWLANHLPEFMAHKIRESPQAAEISQLGPGAAALQTGSRGLVRGMGAGVVGTGALLRGGKEIVTGHPEPAFERANKWLEATGTALPPDASTGERIAYGAGTMIPGTALPIAMGAGVLPTVAGTLAGPLVGGATEKVGSALGLPERFGPLAGLIGGIAGGGGGSAAAERALERMHAPTSAELINEATKGYTHIEDNMGNQIKFDGGAIIDNIVGDIDQRMQAGGNHITAKKVYKTLGQFLPDDADQGVSLGQLWGLQKNLKQVAQETNNKGKPTPNAYWANQIVRKTGQFFENAADNPQWAVQGQEHLPEFNSALVNANGNYAAGMRSQDFIRNVLTRPTQKVSSTYTMGNIINQIRQGARYMLDPAHPHRVAGWNDEEIGGLNQILHGLNPVQNLMRLVGRLAPDNALGLWGAMGGAGFALAGQIPAAVPVVGAIAGMFARKLGSAVQRRQINSLDKRIRLRSPLGTKLNSEAEGGNEAEEAEGGIAGVNAENLSEITHHGMQTGADISRGARAAIGATSGEGLGETDEDKKKKDGGGYAMGHRLLKAVGGYDSSFFKGGGYDDPRQEAFADPEAFRLHMARLAAAPQTGVGGGQPFPQTGIGGGMPMGRYQVGGYNPDAGGDPIDLNNPAEIERLRAFVNPQPMQMTYPYTQMRQSTNVIDHRGRPQERGDNLVSPYAMQPPVVPDPTNPMAQQLGINSIPWTKVPIPRSRPWFGGGYDDSRMPQSRNVEDRRAYDESKLHWPWTIHANEKKFYPQGDPIFQAPMIPPPVYTGQLGAAAGINNIPGPPATVGATGPINFGGGYDGVTGLLDQLAGPIVREHQQPWNMGRAASILGQALTTMGPRAGPEMAPQMTDVISPTQFGAAKSPQVLAPQYSTGKSDRLPMGNVPWPQVPGGYRRRRGGYGMGQVSPLAGGGGY